MRVLEVRNYGEMSALAAELIGAQVLLKPRCVLGLATGSSPIGTYERLVEGILVLSNYGLVLEFLKVMYFVMEVLLLWLVWRGKKIPVHVRTAVQR